MNYSLPHLANSGCMIKENWTTVFCSRDFKNNCKYKNYRTKLKC